LVDEGDEEERALEEEEIAVEKLARRVADGLGLAEAEDESDVL
jgi:hypothetical protein